MVKSLNKFSFDSFIKLRNILKTTIKNRIGLTSMLLIVLGFSTLVSAQTFEEAKNFAFNGERAKARAICRTILANGFDSDVALLMGRTFAWDSQYDSARVVLQNVLVEKPDNTEALSALADVEYWNDRYPEAIEYCDRYIQKEPFDDDIQYKKARILYSAERYDEAYDVLANLLNRNSDYSEAMILLDKVRLEQMKNNLTVSYTFDYFDNAAYNKDPWQLLYVQYGRKTSLGSVIGRVNYADRFGSKALQAEADAYPKISENNYLYLNYGFSSTSFFPNHRGGLELYHSFPHAFEGSIGGRLLHFKGSQRVIIYTGSFGKYLGDYWISLRPFVTPGGTGTSVSALLITRRYFSDPQNYIGLRLGYGNSPDERRILFNRSQIANLRSQSVKVDYNHIFNNRFTMNVGVAYSLEEYWSVSDDKIKSGNIYSAQLGLSYLF